MRKLMLILSVIVVALFLVSCSQQGSNGAVAGQATKAKQTAAPKECAGKANGFMLQDCGLGITSMKICMSGVVKEQNCLCANEKEGKVLVTCSGGARQSQTCRAGKVVNAECPVNDAESVAQEAPPAAQVAPISITECGAYGPGNFVLAQNLRYNSLNVTPDTRDQCIILEQNSRLDCQLRSITDASSSLSDGIYIASNTTVVNCMINNFNNGISGGNLVGINITNNTITGSRYSGIMVNRGNGVVLDRNTIVDSPRLPYGIYLEQVTGALVTNSRGCGHRDDMHYSTRVLVNNVSVSNPAMIPSGRGNTFTTSYTNGNAWPVVGTDYTLCQ